MGKEVAGYILCSNWIPTQLREEEIVRVLDLKFQEELPFGEGLMKTHADGNMDSPNILLISPLINSWRLVMGSRLGETEFSKEILEKLSEGIKPVFSFGVDIWTDYHFWMMAEQNRIKRYILYGDGQMEGYGTPQAFEQDLEVNNYTSVFHLSEKYGLDMESIQDEDLARMSNLYEF